MPSRSALLIAVIACANASILCQSARVSMMSDIMGPSWRLLRARFSSNVGGAVESEFLRVVSQAVASRRADVCQRALDLSDGLRELATSVLDTLIASAERDGFEELIVACAPQVEKVVLAHGHELSRERLLRYQVALDQVMLAPGASDDAFEAVLAARVMVQLQLSRLKGAQPDQAADLLYQMLWSPKPIEVKVAGRIASYVPAWHALIERMASDAREPDSARLACVRAFFLARRDGREDGLDDACRSTLQRVRILNIDGTDVRLSAYALFLMLAEQDGLVRQMAAERLVELAPHMSGELADVMFNAWPSDEGLARLLVDAAKRLPDKIRAGASDAIEQAAKSLPIREAERLRALRTGR